MAELRYVRIPKSVDVVVSGAQWTFYNCLCHVVDHHPSFNQTATGAVAAARIIKLFDGKAERDVVMLDQDDWKRINTAFEAPAAGYIGRLTNLQTGEVFNAPARLFVPYIEAVSDEATKKPPEPMWAEKASLPAAAA